MSSVRALSWWAFWVMWGLGCAVLICRTVPLGSTRSALFNPSVRSVVTLSAEAESGKAVVPEQRVHAVSPPYPERAGDQLEWLIASVLVPDGEPSGLSQRVAIVMLLLAMLGWWIGAHLAGAGGAGMAIGAVLFISLLRLHLVADSYRWGMIFAPLVVGGPLARGRQSLAGTCVAACALILWSSLEPLSGLALLAASGWALGALLSNRNQSSTPAPADSGKPLAILIASALSLHGGLAFLEWGSWLAEVATPLTTRRSMILEPLGLISPQVADCRGAAFIFGLLLFLGSRAAVRQYPLQLADVVLFGAALGSMLVARGFAPFFYAAATLLLARQIDLLLPALRDGRYSGVRALGPLVPLFALAPVLFRTPLCETAQSLQSEAFNMLSRVQQSAVGGADSRELRLFNDLRAGEALVYGRIPLLIDGRTGLILPRGEQRAGTPTLADDYAMILRVLPGWEEAFRRWRFNAVLVRRESSLAGILIKGFGWKEEAISASVPIIDRGREVITSWVLIVRPE